MFRLLLLPVIAFIALSQPAEAYNEWYKQGFADGVIYKEQQCQTSSNSQVSALYQQNQQLRRQLQAMQVQFQQQQMAAFNGTQSSNTNSYTQEELLQMRLASEDD